MDYGNGSNLWLECCGALKTMCIASPSLTIIIKCNDHITEHHENLRILTPGSRAKLHSVALIEKRLPGNLKSYLDRTFIRNRNRRIFSSNFHIKLTTFTACNDDALTNNFDFVANKKTIRA